LNLSWNCREASECQKLLKITNNKMKILLTKINFKEIFKNKMKKLTLHKIIKITLTKIISSQPKILNSNNNKSKMKKCFSKKISETLSMKIKNIIMSKQKMKKLESLIKKIYLHRKILTLKIKTLYMKIHKNQTYKIPKMLIIKLHKSYLTP
jgi:hypothetical protein